MDNKDNVTAKRQLSRAKADGCIGSFTGKEWHDTKSKYGFICVRCFAPEAEKVLIPDHVIPLGDGGTNYIGNIQPICRNCNSARGASKTNNHDDYRPLFGKKILSRIIKNSLTPEENEDCAPGEHYIIIEEGKFKLKWILTHFSANYDLIWRCRSGYRYHRDISNDHGEINWLERYTAVKVDVQETPFECQ